MSEKNRRVGGCLRVAVGGGCLGERSVDRFQAWYFPDRLNGKGQRSAALVSYERKAVCVYMGAGVCIRVCVHVLYQNMHVFP